MVLHQACEMLHLFQSLVLITRLPFVALFSQLVSIIAPGYFENGEPSLEAGGWIL